MESTTDLPVEMQCLECMGDSKKKIVPPQPGEEEEDVTPALRELVRGILNANKITNATRHQKKGMSKHLPSNQAELADLTQMDKTLLRRMLGSVNPRNNVKLVDRSVYVGRIRKALSIDVVSIEVPHDRAVVLRDIASLPNDLFLEFSLALRKIRSDIS
jgi:hypothetical protein